MQNTSLLNSASVSDRGLSEKRPQNEDSFLELPERGIFAVADGVGGAQAGDVASQMAVEIVGEAFINMPEGSDAEAFMRTAFERANSAIHQMSRDLPQLSTMATTIVALHIADNIATIGHVGDSRLYRLGRNSGLVQETDDHSIIAEEVRAGRMTPEEAEVHPSRNVISRALGAEPTVDVDLKTIMVDPGTAFLLCSDGITRHVNDAEIESYLSSGRTPADVCGALKAACYERGAEDNLTAVVVNVPVTSAGDTTSPKFVDEDDESTLATARPNAVPPASPAITVGSLSDSVDADDTIEIDRAAPESVGIADDQRVHTIATPPEIFGVGSETASAGGFSRVLLSVLMLLLGAIGGAAAAYYFFQPKIVEVQQAPQITEMKTQNIPLTAFEENRRMVDKDPSAYLSANASDPQDAEDHFLLGRAYLLTGKYWDAKREFVKSRDLLSSADEADSKTLSTEIAMALAIINSGPAQEAFARDVSANSISPNPDANAAAPASSAEMPPGNR
jgi:protein phosphatase